MAPHGDKIGTPTPMLSGVRVMSAIGEAQHTAVAPVKSAVVKSTAAKIAVSTASSTAVWVPPLLALRHLKLDLVQLVCISWEWHRNPMNLVLQSLYRKNCMSSVLMAL